MLAGEVGPVSVVDESHTLDENTFSAAQFNFPDGPQNLGLLAQALVDDVIRLCNVPPQSNQHLFALPKRRIGRKSPESGRDIADDVHEEVAVVTPISSLCCSHFQDHQDNLFRELIEGLFLAVGPSVGDVDPSRTVLQTMQEVVPHCLHGHDLFKIVNMNDLLNG